MLKKSKLLLYYLIILLSRRGNTNMLNTLYTKMYFKCVCVYIPCKLRSRIVIVDLKMTFNLSPNLVH